jgi:hypothetical protein
MMTSPTLNKGEIQYFQTVIRQHRLKEKDFEIITTLSHDGIIRNTISGRKYTYNRFSSPLHWTVNFDRELTSSMEMNKVNFYL